MYKEVIDEKQGVSLIAFFIVGSAIVLGLGAGAGSDVWISVVIAIAATLPFVSVYARIHHFFPAKTVFFVPEFAFGKVIGRGIIFFFAFFSMHLGILVLRNFGEFIITVALEETPVIFPMAWLALVCMWAVREGIEVLGRWSSFFLRVTAVLALLTALMLIPEMNINNFLPVLYNGWEPIFGSAFAIFAFPLAETVVFMLSFGNFRKPSSPYKIYLGGLLLGGVALFVSAGVEIAVMGPDMYQTMYFPAYSAAARINLAGFLQRLEIVVAIIFLFGGFVKVSICLLGATRGFAHVFGFDDYRFLVTPITLFMLAGSYWIYESIIQMNRWAIEVWPFYAFPFQAILPVTVWAVCEIKLRLLNQSKNPKKKRRK